MEWLTIARYTAWRNLKDIRMLGMLMLGPIILILILGSALDGLYQPQSVEPAAVAYLNLDPGPYGEGLTSLLQGAAASPYLDLISVASATDGQGLLASGAVTAFVQIPADFSLAVSRGQSARIDLFSPASSPVVLGLLQNYLDGLTAQRVVAAQGGDFAPADNDYLDSDSVRTEGKLPRAMDYFAVQTLLQFMLMGSWYGIASVQEDREKNTAVRLQLAPVKPHNVLLGKLTANILVLFLQVTIVALFTKFVYGADWSGSLPAIAATLLLFAVICIGLGTLIGSLFSAGTRAFTVLWCCMFCFSVVSGAFGKVAAGSLLGRLAVFSPNHYASQAIFGAIFDGQADLIGHSLLVLLAMAVTVYGLTIGLRRRSAR